MQHRVQSLLGWSLPTPRLFIWFLDAARWQDGEGPGGGGSTGGRGQGTSLARTVARKSFPVHSAPGAVPVQGLLGLMRPGSAVAMTMGEGG